MRVCKWVRELSYSTQSKHISIIKKKDAVPLSCLRSPSLAVRLHCLLCQSSLLIYSHCHFHLISAVSLSSLPAEATCWFTEQGQTSERERWHLIQSLPSFTLNPSIPFTHTHTFSSSVFIHQPLHSSVLHCGRRWLLKHHCPKFRSIGSNKKKKKINMQLSLRAKWNLLP